MRRELIFLGTGEAMVTKCYHACFLIQTEQSCLLVDAGGGNGILTQLEKAAVSVDAIDALFITHIHTDHFLGAIWLLRDIGQKTNWGQYKGHLTIFGHEGVIHALRSICEILFAEKLLRAIERSVSFRVVTDGQEIEWKELNLQFFDIQSVKCRQFALRADFPDGTSLAYLGDEPFKSVNRQYAEGVDWLISEAYCLYSEADVFKPYEISHSTALDAGKNAKELGAKNLILIHTEDFDLPRRRERYTSEAKSAYDGNVFVPEDLERLTLEKCD